MKKPLIGVTTSIKAADLEKQDSLQFYLDAVNNAGGDPQIISSDSPLEEVDELVSHLNGLILSGGGDVQTRLYQGDESQPVEEISKARDVLEIRLVKKALAADLPLLGICRGLQVINVAMGGTLITHIPAQYPSSLQHNNPSSQFPRDLIAHEVVLEPGSRLAGIYAQHQVRVNSRHHQAVKDPADGWWVTARATDGLIEALELPEARFAMGVQWHPENLQQLAGHQNLFKALIASARV
jgi:putative glutamine amidotransferase